MKNKQKTQKPFKYSLKICVNKNGNLYTIETDNKGRKIRKSL